MIKIIIIYLILQVIYVILNTITSILKIKSGKLIASISSAICYAFYVYVLIATATDDMSPHLKAVLVAITNFIGVYTSMWVLEKFKKDKLWKIEATIKANQLDLEWLVDKFTVGNISFNMLTTWDNKEIIVNIYSKSQSQSKTIKGLLDQVNAKYTIYEDTKRL